MSPEEARKLADGYEERQIKYEKKLFTRLKNYFKNKKDEREVNKRLKRYLNKIKRASLDGEYEINIYIDIGDFKYFDICKHKLEEMGYIFIYQNVICDKVTISWKEKEKNKI